MTMKLHLFTGYGVEMEYMIVNRETLAVLPVCDALMRAVDGDVVSESDQGALCWCNELVSHVIELKTNGPVSGLDGVAEAFQADVCRINNLLMPMGAALMPSAMHPWMDPFTETVLWEHEYNEIYAQFNAIFDCRGHGWANLQSTHLNLPFASDEEFGRLHAAIRAILPLLPVLSASSPIMDGKITGILDNRLAVYRNNARKIPSVAGHVIPEAYFTESDYREKLLQKMYDEIAPYDPQGILQDEWLNARGAIARFDRNTIEIRILDIQEFPGADIAIIKLISAVLKHLVSPELTNQSALRSLDMLKLNDILVETTKKGRTAEVVYPALREVLGLSESAVSGVSIWQELIARHNLELSPSDRDILSVILENGSLSERIIQAVGEDPDRESICQVYRKLMECLHTGSMFIP
jgi:glutamate---cysteine ligase / carboxylate-amine ligase